MPAVILSDFRVLRPGNNAEMGTIGQRPVFGRAGDECAGQRANSNRTADWIICAEANQYISQFLFSSSVQGCCCPIASTPGTETTCVVEPTPWSRWSTSECAHWRPYCKNCRSVVASDRFVSSSV